MRGTGPGRPIVVATLIAGTLDLAAAFLLSAPSGVGPGAVLRFVASGPFPPAIDGGTGWAAVGLRVHYGIMAAMAAAFVIAARRRPGLARQPFLRGPLYGLGPWPVMDVVVRPLRRPDLWPRSGWAGTGGQPFRHLIPVGLPIAPVASRRFGRARP